MKFPQAALFAFVIVWSAGVGAREEVVDQEDLRQTEMAVVRNVSRSVFGAQKAERSQAEQAGLMALGQKLKRLQDLLRDRPIVHVGNARIDLAGVARDTGGTGVVGGAGAGGGGGGGAGGGSTRAPQGGLSGPRADRAVSFERAHGEILADKKALRRNLSLLRHSRQRVLAEALLQRLDGMESMLAETAAEMAAGTPRARSMMEALSAEMAPLERARSSQAAPPIEPTMTTRIHHRREIPHVP